MNAKYELIAEKSIEVFGKKLFRVRALISFGNISAGDEGGFIEDEKNISVYGNAWVSGDAQKTPICISGLCWHITISDSLIKIGCECHTSEQWENFSDSEISKMDINALKFWNECREYIFSIAKHHQNK